MWVAVSARATAANPHAAATMAMKYLYRHIICSIATTSTWSVSWIKGRSMELTGHLPEPGWAKRFNLSACLMRLPDAGHATACAGRNALACASRIGRQQPCLAR